MRDIAAAPRDGTLIRLWLHDGTDFVGQFSGKYWGWVALYEIECPLIRADHRFAGWAPIDADELHRIRREWLIQPVRRGRVMSVIVVPTPPAPVITSRIVRAKRP